MVGIAWFNLIFPPQAELEANFMSTGATAQIIGYNNPKMDQLLQQVVLTTDRKAQKALYDQIQELVISDAPHILTIRPDVIWGLSKTFVLPSGVNSLRDFFGSLPRWKTR